MSDELLHELRLRATTGAAPSLSADELERAEDRLGIRLPTALATVYRTVGNGGFGPGYGLIGLLGGVLDDLGRDVIEDYELRRQPDPDDPSWAWPDGLLAICHWGCGIYSCVGCTTGPDPEVIRFDPNPVDGDWSQGFFSEGLRFSEWLAAWLGGADLWKDGFRQSPFEDAPPSDVAG